MKTHADQKDLLDRGGRPTLGDLLEKLEFRPADGSIQLNGARMLLQRASFVADVQNQLTRWYGEHEAQVLLLRLGYRAGREDALFVQQAWPNLDIGDAFTAGTRLHMVTGTVRVETIFNDFDFRSDKFSSEFLWHGSVEASEYHRQYGRALAPVCWGQTGYASGYASQFFRKLVIFKEEHCAAMGHKSCRVVGKTIDSWGEDDPFVQMFLKEVLPTRAEMPRFGRGKPHYAPSGRNDGIDALMLAPVHNDLTTIARHRLHALICGPVGSGRMRAANWLHQESADGHGTFTCLAVGAAKLSETLERLATALRQRQTQHETLVIEGIDALPADQQQALFRLINAAPPRAQFRVIGLSDLSVQAVAAKLRPDLMHALGVLPINLPPLNARADDLPALAAAVLSGLNSPPLTPEAAAALGTQPWPGNLPELTATLHRASLSSDGPITAAQLSDSMWSPATADPADELWDLLHPALQSGETTIEALTAGLYARALKESDGNMSKAARLLGLSRAQLAYRLR
ncbi:XylR N-terminal domain-containing protein [Actibacterium lipolyticum]|uniref:Nitrogen regulation protein NR(I) n=1 Tax=Actibacterium lipolyticum TaxID=1524263 RepID=A0A238L9X3_9RHOB|nr:XylR N-terminal domain-containing protein [Actibacterium lipolyticum]SMX51162.1 Nitrogen regulation protein NR(I) [Actibacterium lipolyticum]